MTNNLFQQKRKLIYIYFNEGLFKKKFKISYTYMYMNLSKTKQNNFQFNN